jgi:hypothetical protein
MFDNLKSLLHAAPTAPAAPAPAPTPKPVAPISDVASVERIHEDPYAELKKVGGVGTGEATTVADLVTPAVEVAPAEVALPAEPLPLTQEELDAAMARATAACPSGSFAEEDWSREVNPEDEKREDLPVRSIKRIAFLLETFEKNHLSRTEARIANDRIRYFRAQQGVGLVSQYREPNRNPQAAIKLA